MPSPYIVTLAGEPSGKLVGQPAVEACWRKALGAFPDPRFPNSHPHRLGEEITMISTMRSLGLLAFSVSILAAPRLHAEGEHHWSYSGDTGPAHWAAVEADYGACGLGKLQSPIDIRDSVATKGALPAIAFDYKPSALKIIDNGHTIQVNYAPGSFITVQGKRYELVQFHFHKPSEEKINGKSADMVAHLVHKDADGNLAVVAVLLKSGQPNRLVETLWKNLPRQKEKEVAVESVEVNAADLLPANRSRVLHVRGVADDAALQRRRHVVRDEDAIVRFQRRSGPLRATLPDERASDATAERAGDSRHAVNGRPAWRDAPGCLPCRVHTRTTQNAIHRSRRGNVWMNCHTISSHSANTISTSRCRGSNRPQRRS